MKDGQLLDEKKVIYFLKECEKASEMAQRGDTTPELFDGDYISFKLLKGQIDAG